MLLDWRLEVRMVTVLKLFHPSGRFRNPPFASLELPVAVETEKEGGSMPQNQGMFEREAAKSLQGFYEAVSLPREAFYP